MYGLSLSNLLFSIPSYISFIHPHSYCKNYILENTDKKIDELKIKFDKFNIKFVDGIEIFVEIS